MCVGERRGSGPASPGEASPSRLGNYGMLTVVPSPPLVMVKVPVPAVVV